MRRWLRSEFNVSVETCLLVACVVFVAFYNLPFWRAFLAGREFTSLATWRLAGCMFVALTLVHFAALAFVCTRWTTKPILIVLCVINAIAVPFMTGYRVYLDPAMVRNIVRTDVAEAVEYLSAPFAVTVLILSAIPIAALSRVKFARKPLGMSVTRRAIAICGALGIAALMMLTIMQDVAPMMRTQRQLRYLITPGNYIYSTVKVARQALRTEPSQRTHWLARNLHVDGPQEPQHKPVLFVLVIGETARADNFSLNGYARDTNPRLRQLDVINFKNVTSCGTATEVSLPCMLSAVGRQGYEDDIAAREDGLIQVLSHAGYKVDWYDNNSGCKGTCEGDGIVVRKAAHVENVALCKAGRCLDEVLLRALRGQDLRGGQDRAIVLHQLGNHGPAYYQRYPTTFARFKPTCDTSDLRTCTAEQIVASYDNGILYTDYILSEVVRWLTTKSDTYNAVMLYIGDHGESLGEAGLYLHGMPYAIAPHVQIHVPMILWLSGGFSNDFGLNPQCIRSRSAQALSHDNLFHSVVGMLSIETPNYVPILDVLNGCEREEKG